MHPVNFFTELGSRFAPIGAGDLKTIQLQLTHQFETMTTKTEKIMQENEVKEKQIFELDKDLYQATADNELNKASDIAKRIEQLKGSIEKPSLFGRVCCLLNKPIVRFGLMIAFGLLSTIIARRLLNKKQKAEDEETEDLGNMQQPYYPQHPYYPQYPQYPQQPFNRMRNH